MKKISKISLMAVGVVTLFTTITSAASLYNKSVSTGKISYADLNKTGSVSAKATTEFIPLSGNSNYKSYAYLEANDANGTILAAKNGYGNGNGTVSDPDVAKIEFKQSGAKSWLSTHRSNNISDYQALTIQN